MSTLTIFAENGRDELEKYEQGTDITAQLQPLGIRFERWQASRRLEATAANEEVLEAYRDSVDRLMQEYGFQSADVVSLHPDHPDKGALREKFLQEHTHSDFEVRFFVDGQGLFYIHAGAKVYAVLCEQGDLISVPANTPHWFDMGERPSFKCIRLFTSPDGWEANYTGDDIANHFPLLENQEACHDSCRCN